MTPFVSKFKLLFGHNHQAKSPSGAFFFFFNSSGFWTVSSFPFSSRGHRSQIWKKHHIWWESGLGRWGYGTNQTVPIPSSLTSPGLPARSPCFLRSVSTCRYYDINVSVNLVVRSRKSRFELQCSNFLFPSSARKELGKSPLWPHGK